MKAILKSVSRSFYLTIKFLPHPLREPVSLAYLLARATDTIADSATIPAAIRLTTLQAFARIIAGEMDFDAIAEPLRAFAKQQSDPPERALIENLRECINRLEQLEPADRDDIRAVLKTITAGQELDLRRFGDPASVSSLQTAAELDEYTYLVAGCVGEFWTKLGFRKSPPFASRPPNEMISLGVAYGKGLQLINVLRDRGADRQVGRSYLPAQELATQAHRRSFRVLAGRSGREARRRHRLLFRPNELADSFCDRPARFDWRAHHRPAARGGQQRGKNQSPAKTGAPHSPRRSAGGGGAGRIARALPAFARAVP